MTTASLPAATVSMALYPVRVARTASVSPHMRRITLTGEGLTAFPFAGPDQRVKLFLPLPGQDRPHLDGVTGFPEYLALPPSLRPVMRTYTVRRHRPQAAEIDLDFALHASPPGHLGPASAWAQAACPGDQAALYGPAASYVPPDGTGWQLIAGDESALPAIGAIVEHLPAGTPARVLIEIPDPADRQDLAASPAVDVRWLIRDAIPAQRSTLLADAVRATPLPGEPGGPGGPAYAWLAGESSVVTGIRRHLVADRGLSRDRVTFTGYWRHGRAEDDA